MSSKELEVKGKAAGLRHPSDEKSAPATVVELLRRRALERPEQVAYTYMVDGEEQEGHLTYGELDRRARAVGAYLQALGAAGSRALLLYPSGLDYIAAFFGCLYAGAVAVPAYPPRPSRRGRSMPRVRAIVNDCQPAVALTTTQILSAAAARVAESPDLQALRWQPTDDLPEGLADEWQQPAVSSQTLAFLQYTSGSTATPKGVMVSHGNLLHNERLIQLAFGQTEDSTIVGWLPLHHDMGLIGNVLQPLYLGARCVLMSPTSFLLRPLRWLQAISQYRATTSGGPNFAYELCVRKVTDEQAACLDLSSWTTAFNGAEPIRPETVARFSEKFAASGFRREAFSPCYGLAEATLVVSGGAEPESSSVLEVDAAGLERDRVLAPTDGGARSLHSSGRPLGDQRVFIVDPETSMPRAEDEVGEIWVAGPSVTHGYWNRPEETAHAFHAHLADSGDGPFLRTGDLGFLKDGRLFVTGRLKDLIVIRGRNHYPQDIELTVERSHPALRPGCGAAFSVEAGDEERLVIVQEVEYRQRPDVESLIEEIRQAAAEEHEVMPYAVVLVTAGTIPKTSSGKIQRHACRANFLAGSMEVIGEWRMTLGAGAEPSEATAPSSPLASAESVEMWLATHLAGKLGVDACEIEINQTLGRYGLDSLAAIELAHSVETAFGVSLPMSSFLQSATVAQLAAQLVARAGSDDAHAAPAPRASEEDAEEGVEHTLSHGQQSLWFLHQLAPESAAYNIAGAALVRGALDASALRESFRALVARHASLRTTFHATPSGPVQRVQDAAEFGFVEEDAGAWGEEELQERLAEESRRPFDLAAGPLLRVALYRRTEGETVALLVVHHIVADFWSFGVVLGELGALYEAAKLGAEASLPALPLRYTDYARWHRELLQGAEGERLRLYWQKQLSGELPVLNLPFDNPPAPVQSFRGDSHGFRLDAGLTAALKALSQEQEATLYVTLLAAFQALMHRYTDQPEVLVGSPTAGRSLAETAGVVGYFVNPVALRADFAGDPTFKAFLAQVRQTVFAAFEHQEYPFSLLVEQLQTARDASRPPLVQVMFTLQKAHLAGERGMTLFALGEAGARMRLGDLDLESVALRQRVAQFDLTLMMAEEDDGLVGSLQFNTDLFEPETVQRMAGHYRSLLEAVAADPDLLVAELPLLTPAEERQLAAWNDTSVYYDTDGLCLHELFERQARRTPDAVAVEYDGRGLTYAELNARANRLARRLRALGVGPESRVGLCAG
ncbi:MAG TPA: condensation domain-containing protein, partial [Pyrinomonadaceae bacterium]